MNRCFFIPAIVTTLALLSGCSHECKTNADCPAGDTCRPTSAAISPTTACGPCVVAGLVCSTNSDCCSGKCPSPLGSDQQVCAIADAGIEPTDAGGDARD